MKTKSVLLISIAFSPNIGGIETHFDDLTDYLDSNNWNVSVLTYTPLTTNVKAKIFEEKGKNIKIYRIPIFKGIFYVLLKFPLLEFLFLIPGLFIFLPFVFLTKARNTHVIHSHGLVAGFVSVFWGKIFGKRIITTTHSIYNFPKTGLYRKLSYWIFNNSSKVLTLSAQSKKEIENLGISKEKIKVFTYWVDQKKFFPINKKIAKKELGWKDTFTVLFVGRLVKEKGIEKLLQAAKKWSKSVNLVIAGVGPLESTIKIQELRFKNIRFLGKIENLDLPIYYSAADMLIVPSIQEEGFGRVIIEALSCGTPIIGSNRGAIPEAIDESVGKLIDITAENIVQCVDNFFINKNKLIKITKNTREFAQQRYSLKNAVVIINSYYE